MQDGYSARQLGYEFVQKEFLEQGPLHIKKIESFELGNSPQSKKSNSDGSNYNPFAQKMSQVPIWKQLLSSGFTQQFNIHPSQYGYGYNTNEPCSCPECCPQMNTQSYPGPYNQQMPYSGQQFNPQSMNTQSYPGPYNQQIPYSGQQFNPQSGNQYYGNQPNPQYQSSYTNQYNNPIPYQNPKTNSNNLKTGFNLINQYNNTHNKKPENQPSHQNHNEYRCNSQTNIVYPSLSPPNQYSQTNSDPLSKSLEYGTHQTCKQHKIRNKNSIQQFAMNKKQKMAWNDWNTILDRIKHSIKGSETQKNLVSNFLWDHLLNKLQPYFLNKKHTIDFFRLLKEYFSIDPQNSNFDPVKFFKKFGDQFTSFETNLFFQHKSYLAYAKFISVKHTTESKIIPVKFLNLTFNMTNQQTLDVAKAVFKLCQHDLDAFSFLSLYLIVSIEKGLTLESFSLVESQFIDTIALLDKEYPASNAESLSSNLFEPDIKIKYEKPTIQFKSSNPRENFKDLQEFVFLKVDKSRYDEFEFRKIVQNVCLKHGYNFKIGHKIKLDNNQYAMLRTIQKILQDIMPKYQDKILKAKDKIINLHKQKQSENGILHNIVRKEIQVVSQLMGEILTAQKEVEFDIKDLLRAKCSFSSVYAIKQALTDLKSSVLSFPDCQIIQTKNNLSKRTRDFAVIIKLPNCIAELQLVLNLNSIPNEFNHKIYQMRRTKLFSPVTNLYLCHNKWSEKFFRKFIELIKHVSKSEKEPKIEENISFKDFKDDTKIFKKIASHFSELNKQKLRAINETHAKDIETGFDQLNHIIYKHHQKMCIFSDEERAINEIRFFLSAKEYGKAKEYFDRMEESEIQKNPTLLELYTEILFKFQQFGKCLQKSLKLSEMYTLPADKLRMSIKIGEIYLYLPDLYEKALEQYHFALEIIYSTQKEQVKSAKFISKDNNQITQADILNSIGVVYLKQNVLDKALQKFNQSQTLYKKNKKGNSMQMAWTYVNIGKVMEAEQKFKQAEENYKAGLEIIEKYKGRYSVEAGSVLRRLCSAYVGMGKLKNYEQSLDCARKAYDIAEHILGKNDIQTRKCLELIERCKEQMEVGNMLENMSVQDKSENKQ